MLVEVPPLALLCYILVQTFGIWCLHKTFFDLLTVYFSSEVYRHEFFLMAGIVTRMQYPPFLPLTRIVFCYCIATNLMSKNKMDLRKLAIFLKSRLMREMV